MQALPLSTATADARDMRARFERLERARLRYGLRGMLWSLCGRIGHALFRRRPPAIAHASGLTLLHLGCGAKHFAGWVNADFYRLHELVFRSRKRADWFLDLTQRFECDADHWDGVFLEHVNEHLCYTQNFDMLSEVHRTLKPGGTLRIAVPCLTRYLDWCALKDEHPKFARYGSLPEAISNLTQNHAHQSIWDAQLLCELLEALGFVDIAEREYGESDLALLAQDGDSHRWESLYLECRKPATGEQGQRAAA